jgi:hypothetical protein
VSGCPGAHCPGCGHGSGGLVVVAAAVAGVLAAAVTWLVANLVLAVTVLVVCTAVTAVAAKASAVLSRSLLRALGGHAVPVGLERLRPRELAAAARPQALPAPQRRAIESSRHVVGAVVVIRGEKAQRG